MAKSFSFDVVSEYDKAEMNNVVDQARREIANRYDFKGTAAEVNFESEEKTGLLVKGENQYQLDAIMEMIRKKAATRGVDQRTFDTKTNSAETTNLVMRWKVPFLSGLDQENAKKVSKKIREAFPKSKVQIQGEELRVSSQKKDELQAIIGLINKTEFDFPLKVVNLR